MKTRTIITAGISALVLSGASAGIVSQASIAVASDHGESAALKQARAAAARAVAALAAGHPLAAIPFAETAVGFDPQLPNYRVLLGQSYLKAGRYLSARQAYSDALTLAPGNGRVALNLALAQIAVGEWDAARQTLDANAAVIPVSDRGLATALAGDPASGVELLTAAARAPEADAKTRQNLALALALAGRWAEAKTMVAVDLTPAEVDTRMTEWASFARPQSASDQVAALLGVMPVEDAGRPAALALNARVPAAAVAAQTADPVDAYMPGKADSTAVAVAEAPAPVSSVSSVQAPAAASVRFNPRQEVVQAIPARAPELALKPRAVRPVMAVAAATMPRIVAKGSYYVQIGAYENAAVAHDAWSRATRRFAPLAAHTPQGMGVTTSAGSFYRLSVGGFARGDATAMCARYKARGGDCFVRGGAGDQLARWAQGPKLASR